MNSINCHCCNTPYLPVSELVDEPVDDEILQDVYACPACDHVYRDYKGDSIEYHTNWYRDVEGFKKDGDFSFMIEPQEIVDGQVTEIFHKNRLEICKSRVNYSSNFLSADVIDGWQKVLDIGSGAGTFARTLKASFPSIEIACIELDDRLVKECARLGFDSKQVGIFDLSDKEKYDTIFMWHVLEHIQDVQASIKKLKKIMHSRAIIEVPLLQAMNGQGRQRFLTSPNTGTYDGHYHYFCRSSFIKLIEACGMKIVDLREGVQSPALLAVIEND